MSYDSSNYIRRGALTLSDILSRGRGNTKGQHFRGAGLWRFPADNGKPPITFIAVKEVLIYAGNSFEISDGGNRRSLSGKTITIRNHTPILPQKERERRKREIEQRLYDVVMKYKTGQG